MSHWKRFVVIVTLLGAPFSLVAQNPVPKIATPDGDFFESPVRPPQSLQCFSCHGLDQQKKSAWFNSPVQPTRLGNLALQSDTDDFSDDVG